MNAGRSIFEVQKILGTLKLRRTNGTAILHPGLYSVRRMPQRRHHLPHIHVRYQGQEAAIAIEDGCVLDGGLPPKQLRMVQVWIDIHQEELMVDWELAVNGDEPFRISPLQ